MANPTVPLSSNSVSVRNYESVLEGVSYGHPAQIYDPSTGQIVWVCRPSLSDVYHTTELGYVVTDQKVGSRHVPYDPNVDNLHPLSYTRNRTERSHLHFVCNNVEIGSTGVGTSCPTWKGRNKVFSSSETPTLLPPLPVTSEMEQMAISRLNDRLDADKAVTVNYAMAYAERRETVRMLVQRSRQVASVLSALRKGKFEKAYRNLFGKSRKFSGKRTKDRAASLWLEWHYGWSPLLGDIYRALDDFTREPPQPLLIVKGKAHAKDTQSTIDLATFGVSRYVSMRIPIESQAVRETSLVYTSCYRMNMRQLVALSSAGIADPLTTAWELIPFSFVADWFVNVGEYIRDMSISHGLDHLYTVRSVKEHVKTKAAGKYTSFHNANLSRAEFASVEGFPFFTHESVSFSRSVSGVRPRLALAINSDPFSLRRAISALALSNQLVRGFGR